MNARLDEKPLGMTINILGHFLIFRLMFCHDAESDSLGGLLSRNFLADAGHPVGQSCPHHQAVEQVLGRLQPRTCTACVAVGS